MLPAENEIRTNKYLACSIKEFRILNANITFNFHENSRRNGRKLPAFHLKVENNERYQRMSLVAHKTLQNIIFVDICRLLSKTTPGRF